MEDSASGEDDLLINGMDGYSSGAKGAADNGSHLELERTMEVMLPIDMRFNGGHIIAISVYSILFIFSAVGNLTVVLTIARFRKKMGLSRINIFLLNLAVADLLVTFLLMPLEIGWAATVSWKAGDAVCRVMAFFRTFGLYLSGFLLVCISLDRYFAVMKPLAMNEADRRARVLLGTAWFGSAVCSIPQAIVFHVERHPTVPWFEQCVTFNAFPSRATEIAYLAFGFFFLYAFPLLMIIGCYLCILWKICRMNRERKDGRHLRRSSMETLSRAKIRTLKLTIVIVATFFLCWTPYNVMALWYWIDSESAAQVDQRIQKGLFLFACTNSCFNPLVYGYFHFGSRVTFQTSRSSSRGLHRSYEVRRKPKQGDGSVPLNLYHTSRSSKIWTTEMYSANSDLYL